MKIILVERPTGKEIIITRNQTFIGRHQKNDIRSSDPHVSGYHCSLARRGNALYVEDIKSSNGTYVNGSRVNKSVKLKHGDVIALAQNGCEYQVKLLSGIVLPLVKIRLRTPVLAGMAGALLLSAAAAVGIWFLTRPPEINVEEPLSAIEKAYGKEIFPDDPGFTAAVAEWARIVQADPLYPQVMERRRLYKNMMESILGEEKIPLVFTYIPWVESGYDPRAVNRGSGAAGMWQLMDFTARYYGLSVGAGVDDRLNPEKSTRAAARFLRDLVSVFGDDDFLLILAAYNAGEPGILASLRRIEDPVRDRNFWYLDRNNLIPEETKAYVVKIVACMALDEIRKAASP